MATVNLSPIFNGYQAFSSSGVPLSLGTIETYVSGTSTPLATYTTAAGNIANANPITLLADGRPPQEIWLIQGSAYRFVLKDSLGNQIGTYDDITGVEQAGAASALRADLADSTDAAKGDAMVAEKRTATGAVATTLHASNEKRKFDVARDFGVDAASSAGAVKAALQLAISAAGALPRGGTVEVPAYLNYGFDVDDRSTWPDFSGVSVPVTVVDWSQGASYGSYPTTYDGCQQRVWMFTPQTTTPGMHDGNTQWLRGAWAPNVCISNDMDLSGGRLASDNRRASFTLFTDGTATYRMGQGTLASSTLTDEELSNFIVEKYARTGDTIASVWGMFLGERKTHRMSYGGGANNPLAAHDFYPGNPAETLDLALFRTPSATTTVSLQSSAGASSRSFMRNNAGVGEWGVQTGGASMYVRQSDAFTCFAPGAAPAYTYHFNVIGSRNGNWIANFNNTNATSGYGVRIDSGTAAGTGFEFLGCYANTVNVMRVRGNGDLQNTNNSYGAISDRKLKQDIAPAGSAWADFKAYQFRKYRLKSDPTGPLQLGVIADEIVEISPGLVDETPERSADGELTGESTKSVKYSVLYLKACVALQEAINRIESLEARLSALERP